MKKAIADDVLERVLEAARIAPSGNNRQPWRFVIVKDEKKKKDIDRACYESDILLRNQLFEKLQAANGSKTSASLRNTVGKRRIHLRLGMLFSQGK